MSEWQKDGATGEHQLIVEGGFWAVVPTAVGDWYAGFQSDDSPCIDEEIEYFDSWQQARAWVDKQIP